MLGFQLKISHGIKAITYMYMYMYDITKTEQAALPNQWYLNNNL